MGSRDLNKETSKQHRKRCLHDNEQPVWTLPIQHSNAILPASDNYGITV